MKVINVMNFVRQCEPRDAASDAVLFSTTEKQLEMLNRKGVDNTFLLQYDALCDEKFVNLFKTKATKRTELGFWYEVVEPLTTACGMPYESEYGWAWDWHIKPGFAMSYTPAEREKLIDEAMRKFKEVFGYYPRTVGSWLLDTHTVNYLCEHYDIDAICICRDQVNIDAYTLVGGYFNQAYYPCKNNLFTPAQSAETQVNTPIIRLLGPDPIYNYDMTKFAVTEPETFNGLSTMEVAFPHAGDPKIIDWFYTCFFKNEDLGFSYTQIGQENSFGLRELVKPLEKQIDMASEFEGVVFQKMGDTGKWFKETYKKTPQTAVVANNSWRKDDVQSVYYDCQKYTLNVFRFGKQIFIRAWYAFDDRAKDRYLVDTCKDFYAVYENMPIVDTARFAKDRRENIGIVLDNDGVPFTEEKNASGGITLRWGDKSIVCEEDGVTVNGCEKLGYFLYTDDVKMKAENGKLQFSYRDFAYTVGVENCEVEEAENGFTFKGNDIRFVF